MAVSVKKTLRAVSLFIFSRYPFINALSFLLLLAERAAREKYPPIEPLTVYCHMGVFILCGICMGFDMRRREAAMVHACQLVFLAVTYYTNEKMDYDDWVRIKMALHSIGLAGHFLLYSHFTMAEPKSPQVMRLGETLVGIYLACSVYMVLQNPQEKAAFIKHMPFGSVSLYVFAVLMAVAALCYLPGLFVNDVTQALVPLTLVTTLFYDCDLHYWTQRRGMDYWNQMRLVFDNFAMVAAGVMYLTCTEKQTYDDETKRD